MPAHSALSRFMAALAGGASLIALVHAQPSLAQQAAQPAAQPEAAGGNGLEEIVVTARRKEEKAQTVPITLTTQTESALEEMHFTALRDIINHTPGLSQGNPQDVSAFLLLRGVQHTAEYFDDAPVLFPPYPGYAIGLDLGGAQVLKGPQGTLFGVSASPGAVLFTTNPPTNDFTGRVEAEAGDYGHKHLEGMLNVPVVDDKLEVRLAGLYQHLNGSMLDVTDGVKLGSQDFDIYRASITLRPSDDIQNDFMGQYYWSDGLPMFGEARYINPQPTITYLGVQHSTGPTVVFGPSVLAANQTELTMGRYAFFGGMYRPGGEYSSNQTYFMNDTARWDINDNMTLKNILAYEEVHPGPANIFAIGPAGPPSLFPLNATAQAQLNAHPLVATGVILQYSEELQIQGKALDDKLGFTAGAIYVDGGTRQPRQGPVYTPSGSATGGAVTGSMSWGAYNTHGFYAQGTYDLGALLDGLSFTVGARYSWDKQYSDSENYSGAGVLVTQAGISERSNKPAYLISLDYQIDPSTLVYFGESKASDHGGVTPSALTTGIAAFLQYATYAPETLNNYEFGIKSDWDLFGMPVRSNASLFYGDYANVVSSLNLSAPSPIPGAPPSQFTANANAATAFIEGFDLDMTLKVTDDLTLHGGAGYTYFKFSSFPVPVAGQAPLDWSDANIFFQPRLTYDWSVTYQLPVLEWAAPGQDLGRMSFTTNYYWQSHNYGGTFYPQVEPNKIPSWGSMDMDVTWNNVMGVADLDGRVYVQNLFQNVFLTNYGSGYNTTGVTGVVVAQPRTWGFSISKKF